MDSFSTFLRTLQEEDRISALADRIEDLEAQVRQQDRTIVGLQNELIRVSRYKHDNLETRLDGIQILLGKAGEYKGREQKRVRRQR